MAIANTQFDAVQTETDATRLSEGDTLIGELGREYAVINAGPFEVYVEDTETGNRKTVDTRRISDGPYRVA